MTARLVSGRSEVSLLAVESKKSVLRTRRIEADLKGDSQIRPSSQAVVMALDSKSLVSSRVMRLWKGEGRVRRSREEQNRTANSLLDSRSEVSSNREFLQRNDHVLPRRRTIRSVREDVSELRVGELNVRRGNKSIRVFNAT